MAGRRKGDAAVEQCLPGQSEADPFDDGGKMPAVDQLPVDGRLAPHRIEAGAIKPGRRERVRLEPRIEPREGACGSFQGRRRGTTEGQGRGGA